ncbi:hypothetical protein INT43_004278 [Umbelopsis isabellina]|uniref:BZIP domain-containing protein n=1 Tax=Mortierella isabellina TaxID=91625 RepID=A0A8H7PHT2_MORIS|nr:hypothetical protein INT43_004278 [Umbelopsis isabellina]
MKAVQSKPVRFVLENESSRGAEPRPRGRKSLDTNPTGDRKARNRQNQRAYRQRQQQQLSESEKERDAYKNEVEMIKQRLIDKNGKLARMADLVFDMERLCVVQGVILPATIRNRLQLFKARAAADLDEQFADISESLRSIPESTQEASASDSSVITNTTSSPLSTIESPLNNLPDDALAKLAPVPDLNVSSMDMEMDSLSSDSSNEIGTKNHHWDSLPLTVHLPQPADLIQYTSARVPIPRHVASYYIQSHYLKRMLDPDGNYPPSTLDPTPLELALADKLKVHPRLRFMPCPRIRERLMMFQDVVDMKEVMSCIVHNAICWGSDPLVSKNWELPERLFRDFWFICDQAMVDHTNEWRAADGRGPIVWDSHGRHVKKDSGSSGKTHAKIIGLLDDEPVSNNHLLQS